MGLCYLPKIIFKGPNCVFLVGRIFFPSSNFSEPDKGKKDGFLGLSFSRLKVLLIINELPSANLKKKKTKTKLNTSNFFNSLTGQEINGKTAGTCCRPLLCYKTAYAKLSEAVFADKIGNFFRWRCDFQLAHSFRAHHLPSVVCSILH